MDEDGSYHNKGSIQGDGEKTHVLRPQVVNVGGTVGQEHGKIYR